MKMAATPRTKRNQRTRFKDVRSVLWFRKFFVRDPLNWEKQRLLWRVVPYTMCTYERLASVYELTCTIERERRPGAFVECGVWKGGCAGLMAAVAHQARSGRKTWLFDSFEGLPEPTKEDGAKAAEYAEGRASGKLSSIDECVGPLGDVQRILFTELKLDPANIQIEKGWFQNTLPGAKDRIGPISVLRLDGDWYDSTKCCLENLYDNVIPGGFVIIDDYNCWEGCRKAVDEFLRTRGLQPDIVVIDGTGVYFRKS
jgi:O-methyltransferase